MRIILFIVLTSFLWACTNNSPQEATTIAEQDTVEVPKDTLHSIKLTFIGDIMGHGNQIRSAAGSSKNLKSKDMADFEYEPCFRYIKPIMEEADIAIGNLEMTLSQKGYYKGYPMFRSPDKIAYCLKDAGFDVLTTCNNHSCDGGLYGVNHTIDVLDSLGITHTGTFKNIEERKKTYPLIIEKEVDGTTFKLAFINYTYSTNGLPVPEPTIVNPIKEDIMLKDIEKAKAQNPDIIIAMMHWGQEYWLNEHSEQKRLTKLLWDNGVDVVIGAHPHVIEPIKTDTLFNADSTAEREVLVAYSLGNFISNQYRKNTDIGLIFELELVKNSQTNQTVIGNHDYIFAWRYIHNKAKGPYKSTYTTIPVSAFEDNADTLVGMSEANAKRMKAVTASMRKHLGKWQSQERKVTLEELGDVKPLVPKTKKDTTAAKVVQ